MFISYNKNIYLYLSIIYLTYFLVIIAIDPTSNFLHCTCSVSTMK